MDPARPALQPRTLPLSVFIGLVVGFYGSVAVSAAQVIGRHLDHYDFERWWQFNLGCDLAGVTLIGYGYFTIANRLYGWHRTLMKVSAWLYLVNLAFLIARPLQTALIARSASPDDTFAMLRWIWLAHGFIALCGLVGMTIAVRAWTRTPIAAVLLVLLAVVSGWVPFLGQWMYEFFDKHDKLGLLFWPLREAGVAVALCWTLWRLPPATPDPRIAAGGFGIAGFGIVGRVVAVVVLALATTTGLAGSATAAKVIVTGAPLAVACALVVCAWGLLRVEAWAPAGFPRIRFVIGAALTAWWGGVQVGGVEELLRRWHPPDWDGSTWTYLGPLIAIAGLALVGFAIAEFAGQRGDVGLQSAAITRTVLVIVLALAGTVVQLAVTKATRPDSVLALGVAAILLGLGALVAMATLLFRAAQTMQDAGPPAARVMTRPTA